MVNSILQDAGFVLNKTYRETRFITPPQTTYVVYNDAYERRGSDDKNLLTVHDISIEVYEYRVDPGAERRIEAQFNERGIEYRKQSRYWLEEQQLYQVIYEFSYITKEV